MREFYKDVEVDWRKWSRKILSHLITSTRMLHSEDHGAVREEKLNPVVSYMIAMPGP